MTTPSKAPPIIHHGTPLTPRAALFDVCAGRAMCVSFWRPDDVEAVEAISPAIMFRQWRIFGMARSTETRRGMVHPAGLDALFRVAGTAIVSTGPVGSDPRCAGRAVTAQRFTTDRLAIRAEGRTALAHGRAARSALTSVRSVRPGLLGLDRQGQASGLPRISCAHGRGCGGSRQSLASVAHDARCVGGARISVHQRRQHQPRAEWMAS